MDAINQISAVVQQLMGRNSPLRDESNYSFVHAAFPNIEITEYGQNEYMVYSKVGNLHYKYKCECTSRVAPNRQIYVEASLYEPNNSTNNHTCAATITIPIDQFYEVFTTVRMPDEFKGRGIAYCIFLVMKFHIDSTGESESLDRRLICLDYYKQEGWDDQYYHVLRQLLLAKGIKADTIKNPPINNKPPIKDVFSNLDEEISFTDFKSTELNVNLLKAVQSTVSAKIMGRIFGCYEFEKIEVNTSKDSEGIESYIRQSGSYHPFQVYHPEMHDVYFSKVGKGLHNVYNSETHVLENIVHIEEVDGIQTIVLMNSKYEKVFMMEFIGQQKEPMLSYGLPFDTQKVIYMCRLCLIVMFSPDLY